MNDDNKILVIKERFMQKPHWKLPGGLANEGTCTHLQSTDAVSFVKRKTNFTFGCL